MDWKKGTGDEERERALVEQGEGQSGSGRWASAVARPETTAAAVMRGLASWLDGRWASRGWLLGIGSQEKSPLWFLVASHPYWHHHLPTAHYQHLKLPLIPLYLPYSTPASALHLITCPAVPLHLPCIYNLPCSNAKCPEFAFLLFIIPDNLIQSNLLNCRTSVYSLASSTWHWMELGAIHLISYVGTLQQAHHTVYKNMAVQSCFWRSTVLIRLISNPMIYASSSCFLGFSVKTYRTVYLQKQVGQPWGRISGSSPHWVDVAYIFFSVQLCLQSAKDCKSYNFFSLN